MKTLTLSPKGLFTNPNTLSEVPTGALNIASNVVCQRPGIVTSRRGFSQYHAATTACTKLFNYNDDLLLYSDGKLKYDTGSGWSAGQTLGYPATDYRPKSALTVQNCYFSSAIGVQKLTSKSATLVQAGVPGGLDLTGALPGGGGFLSVGNQAAYRIVFGYNDANNNLIIGSPTLAAYVITNGGGTASNVALTFTLPVGLTTSHFYRIYRSFQSTEASDELYLALQRNISSGDLSTGTISVTDVTADDQLGLPLYTNSTQEGILAANEPPPFCLDLANYQDHMIYANTRQKHQLQFTMVSLPAVDETITINSIAYTAKNAENAAAAQFDRSGTIETTLRSLERVVNRHAANTAVYAYYLGNGQMLIARRDLTNTSFTVSASVATRYSFDRTTSTAYAEVNSIIISKPNEPEAAPSGRQFLVGRADAAIIRIIPVRDAAYILKEDGVFRLTGTAFENMIVEEHVATIRVRGDENAVRFENSVFMACNQGIVSVNGGGYTRISEAIDNLLVPALNEPDIQTESFSVSYDTERLFIIRVPRIADNEAEMFVFSGETGQWTQWERQDLFGVVLNEKLWLTSATQVYQERKALSRADFADEEYPLTITSALGTTVTVITAAGVTAGMTLKQLDEEQLITAVNGNDLTVEDATDYVAGAATAYAPIRCDIQFVEQDAGDPTRMKHFLETCGVFEDASFAEIEFSWRTNLSSLYARVNVKGKSSAPWGRFAWGRVPWGGRNSGKAALRTYIPRRASRALWLFPRLTLEQAFESFSFAGFSIKFNDMTDKFRSR